MSPGINASANAREHDLNPQQPFGWGKRFGAEAMALVEGDRPAVAHDFAPVVIETTTNARAPPTSSTEPSSIEISIGTATVRIRGAADAKMLALVLKALKVLT